MRVWNEVDRDVDECQATSTSIPDECHATSTSVMEECHATNTCAVPATSDASARFSPQRNVTFNVQGSNQQVHIWESQFRDPLNHNMRILGANFFDDALRESSFRPKQLDGFENCGWRSRLERSPWTFDQFTVSPGGATGGGVTGPSECSLSSEDPSRSNNLLLPNSSELQPLTRSGVDVHPRYVHAAGCRGSLLGGCAVACPAFPQRVRVNRPSTGGPHWCVSPLTLPCTSTAFRPFDIAKQPFPSVEQQVKRGHAGKAFKTALCTMFEATGTCSYGNACRFAHGVHELRPDGLMNNGVVHRHPKYKTKLCNKYWTKGFCSYGSACNFIHEKYESTLGNSPGGCSATMQPSRLPSGRLLLIREFITVEPRSAGKVDCEVAADCVGSDDGGADGKATLNDRLHCI